MSKRISNAKVASSGALNGKVAASPEGALGVAVGVTPAMANGFVQAAKQPSVGKARKAPAKDPVKHDADDTASHTHNSDEAVHAVAPVEAALSAAGMHAAMVMDGASGGSEQDQTGSSDATTTTTTTTDDDHHSNDAIYIGLGVLAIGVGAAALAGGGGGGGGSSAANVAPVVTAATAAATEDGAKVSGKITATDANNDTLTYALKSGTTAPAGFTLSSDGSYTFDPTNAAYQSLGAGKTTQAVANVTVTDGKGGSTDSTVTVTVTGVNDAAVIAGTKTGAVTEDAATTTATGTLTVTDADTGEATFQAQAGSKGTYGSFVLGTDGKWTYTIDNSLAAVQALGAGKTATDSFAVKSADGTSDTVVVTVTGVNDAATISGTKTGAVTEDAAVNTATGTLVATDVDTGESVFQAFPATTGTYGSFAMGTDVICTYTLNNSDSDTQALGAGKTGTDTFTVKSADGTTQAVTITVTGVNDAATISGTKTGALTEDSGTTSVAGTLTVADVDTGENAIVAQTNKAGTYGTFSIGSDGKWTYAIDNSSATIQSLNGGKVVTDSFVVKSVDGTASETVTVSITGTNDAATISGTKTGAVTEDAAVNTATGTLVVTDIDAGENIFQAVPATTGTYGSFAMGTDGKWTYTLDNSDKDTQALGEGKTGTETFTVKSFDGTASQAVTITVTGANDPATISGTKTGAVTEDAAVNTATGTLVVSDVDTGENIFQAVPATTGTYGSFAMGTDGKWTYTLDNSDKDTQALGAGKTGTETFTVHSSDGTATDTVTITVNGTNDTATISGTSTGAVTEDAAVNTATGTLLVADVDTGENAVQAGTTTGTYGSFSIAADGKWTYTLDNNDSDTQALTAGQTVTEVFAVKSVDGTATQNVTISVTGANEVLSLDGGYPGDDNNPNSADTINAALNGFNFTDNGNVTNNVVITNLGVEDRFVFTKSTNAGADPDYSFSRTGTDLVINYGNGGGASTNIVLKDAVAANAPFFNFSESDANAALNTHFGTTGVDFFQIA